MANMAGIISFLGSHWMIIAFMAPLFWSLVNVVDVYFVDGIYKDELEAAIISGLFQIIPWFFLLFFVNIRLEDVFSPGTVGSVFGLNSILFVSLLGGIVYTLGIYFYFKALFNYNDAPFLQILATTSVIIVPLLSFLLFGERLPITGYIGMAITFAGAILLSFDLSLREKIFGKYLKIMLGAVFLLSLSMILEEHAYGILNEQFGARGFWMGFLFFSLGAFLGGLLLACYFKRNPFPTIGKYYKIFLLGEGLYFLGNFASQKAIDSAPSVSYVAVIETFGPVFIMTYSFIILFVSSIFSHKNSETIKRIYSEQIRGIWVKVFATVVMAAGVYVISI